MYSAHIIQDSNSRMNVIIHNWQKNKFELADGSTGPPNQTLQTLKWMPGDVISSSWSVLKRTCGRVIGIVDVLNRTRFGTTARGVPLYIMYPIDVTYPPFLVALKTKPDTNILACVKYEHWDGLWPRAGFERCIGPVGDLKSELNAMIQTLPPLPVHDASTQPHIPPPPTADWDVVLHIDPPGCKDIDDVLCWKYKDSNNVVFGIGISDVAHWIAEGSELDRCAFERGATLYNEGVAIEPMFPTFISESLASLRCDDTLRPVICLTFELTLHENVWRCSDFNGRWESHMLRVNESYTYESITEHARAKEIRDFLGTVCGYVLSNDSHEWIERAMILYNRRVAEELQHAGVGLLRIHTASASASETKTNEEYMTLAMETGCREIGWLGASAGKYVDPRNNVGHTGLSLACYTHASSPIRRYVDLLNQRWIRALKFGFPAPTLMCNPYEFNLRSKRIRRIERELYFLTRVLHRASCDGGDTLPSAIGYVIDSKPRVYVPDWKRVIVCRSAAASGFAKGTCVRVRMYLDLHQADWSRRFIYQVISV